MWQGKTSTHTRFAQQRQHYVIHQLCLSEEGSHPQSSRAES